MPANGRWDLIRRLKVNLTFNGPCIVIYSCNKSPQDALFLNFVVVKNSTLFRTYLLSIIRNLITVFTTIGICHTGYVDCLLSVTVFIIKTVTD